VTAATDLRKRVRTKIKEECKRFGFLYRPAMVDFVFTRFFGSYEKVTASNYLEVLKIWLGQKVNYTVATRLKKHRDASYRILNDIAFYVIADLEKRSYTVTVIYPHPDKPNKAFVIPFRENGKVLSAEKCFGPDVVAYPSKSNLIILEKNGRICHAHHNFVRSSSLCRPLLWRNDLSRTETTRPQVRA
jgi:hypothetical protein